MVRRPPRGKRQGTAALQDLADSSRGRPGRASVLECVRRSRADLPLWRGAVKRPRGSLPRPADEKRWQATRTPRPRGLLTGPAWSRQRLGVRAAKQSGAAALAVSGRTGERPRSSLPLPEQPQPQRSVRRDGDEAEKRGLVGEDAGDAGPAFAIRVDPFGVVGGTDVENVSRTDISGFCLGLQFETSR